MSYLPQTERILRAARVRPAEYTPAVLRVDDGSCTQATLEMFSLTGGLLSLPKPLDRGSRARVMFLTQTGPVLGMAEMLCPVSWTEQPFRFVALLEDAQRKLRAATQPAVEIAVEIASESAPAKGEGLAANEPSAPPLDEGELWIQKYRTAIYDAPPPRRRLFGKLFAAVTAASLGLGAIVYAFHSYLLK